MINNNNNNNTIRDDDDDETVSVAALLSNDDPTIDKNKNNNKETSSPPWPLFSIGANHDDDSVVETQGDISPSFLGYQYEIYNTLQALQPNSSITTNKDSVAVADFTVREEGAEELLRGVEQYGVLVPNHHLGMAINGFVDDYSPSSSCCSSSRRDNIILPNVKPNKNFSSESSSTTSNDGSSFQRLNGRNTYLKVSEASTESFTFKFKVFTKPSDGRGTKVDTSLDLTQVGTVCVNCSLCVGKANYINLKDANNKKKCVLDVLRKKYDINRGLEVWIQIDGCQEYLNVYCQMNKLPNNGDACHNIIHYNCSTCQVALEKVDNLTSYFNSSNPPKSIEYQKETPNFH